MIGADDGAGVLVMTDVGDGPTIEALLHGDAADAAREALVAFGRTVGALHAATLGKWEGYHAIRTALGPADAASLSRAS